MFFVSVGSIDKPFLRLLSGIESLPEIYRDKIIYQGYVRDSSAYSFKILPYMNRTEYSDYLKKAELVIIHCGIGTIYECATLGKKTLIFPRLSKYGEHNNDHQLEIFKELSEHPIPNVYPLLKLEKMEDTIKSLCSKEIENNFFVSSILNLKRQIQLDTGMILKS